MENNKDCILVKKYSNRRLYNTQISEYITHLELIEMILRDEQFKVIDASTKEDLTKSVLLQILLEQEQKGYNLFPDNTIRQLIKAHDSKACIELSKFLTASIDMFFSEKQPSDGTTSEQAYSPMKLFNEITKKNMEVFGKSMQIFATAGASSRKNKDE